MLLVKVEGVYESDIGTGQKKYTDFNYSIKTSRLTEKGIQTHIAKRFIPMLIANDKTKKSIFSRLRSLNILSIEHVEDDKENIIGKNINELNAYQIQDLACTFDLYDVPLHGKHTMSVVREKAVSAYLKKVWGINLDERNSDGSLKYDLDEVIVKVPDGYLQKKKKETQKLKVSDLIHGVGALGTTAGQVSANEVKTVLDETFYEVTGGQDNVSDSDSGFPTVDDLTTVK